MKRRLNFLIFSLFSLLIVSAQAAWQWPFGHDEDGTNAPPRLHRLLEKANDYIELAEDAALNGNADKAIENYKLALGELDRVEAENPDRAEKPEFAPLRNRRAVCTAAIDAIRFAQVNENERPVAVSDTTELQKKWNKKHGIKDPEEVLAEKKKAEEAAAKKKAEEEKKKAEEAAKKKAEDEVARQQLEESKRRAEEAEQMKVEEESARQKAEEEEKKKGETAKEEKKDSQDAVAATSDAWSGQLREAMEMVRKHEYLAAEKLLKQLLKERPNDLSALLLRAAAQSGNGCNYTARHILEKAMRAHPRSYLPYYNLANVVLILGEGEESARQYYEMGRMVGGPVNDALEARLKKREAK